MAAASLRVMLRAGAEGAVRVADDVNAVALGLLHFGDGQLTVFVGLACG